MIYENNEEKRSTLWRSVLTVSSVLIIIIVVFFLTKLFTGNPLEGKWVNESSGGMIEITEKDEIVIRPEGSESYTVVRGYVDRKTKILTVGLSGEGSLDPEASAVIQPGSYDYSVEHDVLTLTEREYGDQLVFIRGQE